MLFGGLYGPAYFGPLYFGVAGLPSVATTLTRRARFVVAEGTERSDGRVGGAYVVPVAAIKDPNETLLVELDLYAMCISRWGANDLHDVGDYIRPYPGTGLAARCTTPGTSQGAEPRWKGRALNEYVSDGPVLVWQMVDAQLYGINPITNVSAAPEGDGSISGIDVADGWKILAAYSGGLLGSDFVAAYSFTLNGMPRVVRHTVQVRKS